MPEMPPVRQLPALGAPDAHPLFCAAVSGALSSQQLPTWSLPPSWGPTSGAPTQARWWQGRPERIGQLGLNHPASPTLMPDLKQRWRVGWEGSTLQAFQVSYLLETYP